MNTDSIHPHRVWMITGASQGFGLELVPAKSTPGIIGNWRTTGGPFITANASL